MVLVLMMGMIKKTDNVTYTKFNVDMTLFGANSGGIEL